MSAVVALTKFGAAWNLSSALWCIASGTHSFSLTLTRTLTLTLTHALALTLRSAAMPKKGGKSKASADGPAQQQQQQPPKATAAVAASPVGTAARSSDHVILSPAADLPQHSSVQFDPVSNNASADCTALTVR